MADTSGFTGTDERNDDGAPPGMPRWVKASAIIGAIVVLVVVAAMLLGGGDHGPGRHAPGDSGSDEVDAPADHGPPASGHR